jgi:hypothetical protein
LNVLAVLLTSEYLFGKCAESDCGDEDNISLENRSFRLNFEEDALKLKFYVEENFHFHEEMNLWCMMVMLILLFANLELLSCCQNHGCSIE